MNINCFFSNDLKEFSLILEIYILITHIINNLFIYKTLINTQSIFYVVQKYRKRKFNILT